MGNRHGKDRNQRERNARRSCPGPGRCRGLQARRLDRSYWRPGRQEAAKVALDEALGAEAFLLGRRSYEFLAARWPSGSGPLADRLNSLPKYVVSSTLEDPGWNNTTVLKGDVVEEVSKLKQELNGEIVLAASFQLLHTLMEHDLVDELRLMIYPVVLGAGERLFGESTEKKPMRLVSTRTVDDLALLIYELVPPRS